MVKFSINYNFNYRNLQKSELKISMNQLRFHYSFAFFVFAIDCFKCKLHKPKFKCKLHSLGVRRSKSIKFKTLQENFELCFKTLTSKIVSRLTE